MRKAVWVFGAMLAAAATWLLVRGRAVEIAKALLFHGVALDERTGNCALNPNAPRTSSVLALTP